MFTKKIVGLLKKRKENVDPRDFFAYNRIMETENVKNRKRIRLFRFLTTALCLLTIGFIFFNSLQTGEESSAQSSKVVQTVQEAIAVVAPESPLVSAEGEAYELLHEGVRNAAHFCEFALLGFFAFFCYFSYTKEKKWLHIPLIGFAAVAGLDEGLQTLTAGRGAEWKDFFLDFSGACCGFLFGVCAVCLIFYICTRIKRKKGEKNGNEVAEI